MSDEALHPKPREPRWLLVGAIGVLVLACLAIFFGQMNLDQGSPGTLVTSAEPANVDKSVVSLRVTVEAINPSSGFASLRLSAHPGPALPTEGVVIFSSLGGAPAI